MNQPALDQRCHSSATRSQGFTMVELLVAVVIGGIIMTGMARVIVSQVKSTNKQLSIQQLRNDWNRLSYLIASEVGEGTSLSLAQATTGCNTSTTSLFTITVPIFNSASPGSTVPTRSIHYYTTGTGADTALRRCGPAISDGTLANTTRAGQLDPNTANALVDSLLITGIPVTAALSTDSRSVTITPTTAVSDSVEAFTVRTKVRLI